MSQEIRECQECGSLGSQACAPDCKNRRVYRVTVCVETFMAKDIEEGDVDPIRDTINHAVSDDYEKVMQVMSDALAKLDVDPLFGPEWEG